MSTPTTRGVTPPKPTPGVPARSGPPAIRDFLAGKTLLVTGSTGFLAKAIVEKILFEAPDVGRLDLLIRPRKRGGAGARGASSQARLEQEILDSPAMARIRAREGPAFAEFVRRKVRAVEGDLSRPGLALSAEERARLLDEVDVVVNSAATVVFDERIDQALALNTLAPSRLLALAREARKRVVFVQISTCYVCGRRTGFVPETIVETPSGPGAPRPPEDLDREVAEIQAEIERALAETQTEGARRRHRATAAREAGRVPTQAEVEAAREEDVRETLVALGMRRARARGWNDTYTYTKALGERLLLRGRGDVPTAILRPSIIESSLAEPMPGWIDGYRMADPLIAAYGRGRLSFFPARPDVGLDIMPLDLTVNAILASLPRTAVAGGIAVYQIASTSENQIKIRQIVDLMTRHFKANPMRDAAGRPIAVQRFRFMGPTAFRIRSFLSYQVPLAIVRAATLPLAFLPSVRRFRRELEGQAAALEQLFYFSDIYGPYTCLDCRFATDNTRALLGGLDVDDRACFPFDPASIDWARYIGEIHIPGLRRNVLGAEARSAGEWAGMERVIEKAHPHETLPAEGWQPEEAAADVAARPEAAAADDGVASLRGLLARSAERFGARTALQVKRGGEWTRFTYSGLLARSDELGRRLAALGIHAGDRAVLWSESRPEWGLAYLAVTGIGAAAVPTDPQIGEADLVGMARMTAARLVIASDACLARLSADARRTLAARGPVLRIDAGFAPASGEPLPPPLDEARIDRAAVTRDTLASIIFTSGTTVAPKGVMLTHGNFLANVGAVRQVASIGPSDAFLSVLPLYHAFEFTAGFLTPLASGASVTYLSELSSTAIVGAMRETRTTVLLGVPRLYALLYDGIRRRIEEASPIQRALFTLFQRASRAALRAGGSSVVGRLLFAKVHATFGGRVRMFVSGGAALDPSVYREFREMGFEIVEGYGLTETAPVLAMNPPGASREGSVGPAVPGVALRISRPDRAGVGEVVASGASVMRGYFERAEETSRVLANGWFRTGDLGYLDADGYLYLTGRIKDLIVTAAGKNVYPDEVEALYKGIPGVKEFTVIGVRGHGAIGEEVHAVVVPDAAALGAAAEDEGALLERVRVGFTARASAVPTHQHVHAVHLWRGDLPKTSTLKVKRARVRAEIEGRLAAAPGARDGEAGPGGAGAPRVGRVASPTAERIVEVLARLTGIPASEITPAKSLELDLGVDSLMRVEIAAFLESRFGLALSYEQQLALRTVGEILDAVERVGGAPPARGAGAVAEADSREMAAYWERELASGRWTEGSAADVRPSIFYPAARAALLAASRVLYGLLFRLRFEGRERIPAGGSFIVAANHASHLDSLAVLLAMGPRARRLRAVVAKDYFFRSRASRWFFGRLLHAIPFDRNENFLEGLRICRDALLAGHSLLIFPEGTRSVTGALQPFKLGVGILASALRVPIVPARIEGAYEALPKGRALPRPGLIRVVFGEPIAPDGASAPGGEAAEGYEAYKRIVERVRRAIDALGEPPR